MSVANLLTIGGYVLLGIVASTAAYHLLLTLVGIVLCAIRKRGREQVAHSSVHTFVVLIPAHNEEECIARTLQSCQDLHYPQDQIRIIVIADNCSDDTATIARAMGVTCWERTDEIKRGKGQALEWAFTRLLAEAWDAALVLDADCLIDTNAIHRFDEELVAGHQVLQAKYSTSNPDENAQSYLLAAANVHENELFYAPKSALGLAVILRGTGMVFCRAVLQRFPWNAGSIVEDAQFGYRLLAHQVRVQFVPDVCVQSPFPTSRKQLVVQRTRWISGNAEIAREQAYHMLRRGVVRGNLRLIDAALNSWLNSKPFVLMLNVTLVAVASLAYMLAKDDASKALLVCSVAVVMAYISIAVVSVLMLGVTARRVRFWILLPVHASRYVILSAAVLAHRESLSWQRTPRRNECGDEHLVA